MNSPRDGRLVKTMSAGGLAAAITALAGVLKWEANPNALQLTVALSAGAASFDFKEIQLGESITIVEPAGGTVIPGGPAPGQEDSAKPSGPK